MRAGVTGYDCCETYDVRTESVCISYVAVRGAFVRVLLGVGIRVGELKHRSAFLKIMH